MTDQTQTRWTAESILDFLHTHRNELQTMGVTKIGLFGSYVRGEQRLDSDADFLLQMTPFTYRGWMNVWNFLEDNLTLKIDLIPEKNLREELRPIILREVRYVPDL